MHPMNTQNPKGKVLTINEYTAFKRYSLAHHPHTYIQFGSKLTLGSNKICTAANWASSFLCQLYSPSNCSLLKTDPMFIMKWGSPNRRCSLWRKFMSSFRSRLSSHISDGVGGSGWSCIWKQINKYQTERLFDIIESLLVILNLPQIWIWVGSVSLSRMCPASHSMTFRLDQYKKMDGWVDEWMDFTPNFFAIQWTTFYLEVPFAAGCLYELCFLRHEWTF